MNKFLRGIFFGTAVAPIAVVKIIRDYYEYGYRFEYACWLVAGALSCLLPYLIIAATKDMGEKIPFEANKIESNEWILITCTISYLIPLIFKINSNLDLALVLIFGYVLLATLSSIPAHPLLHLVGYRFYKVEGQGGIVYTLIARRKIIDRKEIKTVRLMSHQLLLEG